MKWVIILSVSGLGGMAGWYIGNHFLPHGATLLLTCVSSCFGAWYGWKLHFDMT